MQGYVNNLKARLSHSPALNVPYATGARVCPLPPIKARQHRRGQEDAQGVYFGSVHGISMAQASLELFPPGFSLAWICLIPPTSVPATAWPHTSGVAEHSTEPINIKASSKVFGPAGVKFLILPLWTSSSLLSAFVLMPMSMLCLSPAGSLHWRM